MGLLGPYKYVGHVLVLAKEGDVKKDLQGLAVSSHHYELGLSTVQGLCGLVCSLPELLVVCRLLDEVENLGAEGLVSQGVGFGVYNFFSHFKLLFFLDGDVLLCSPLILRWITASRKLKRFFLMTF